MEKYGKLSLNYPCNPHLSGAFRVAKVQISHDQLAPLWRPGPGCSKLTTSLVNVLLKFQTLVSETCQ